MAYTLQTDEELKKKQGEDSLSGTEGVGVADKPAGDSALLGATTPTAATPAPASQSATQAPKVSGGFTDVNKYLDPNKAQTMGLANKVGNYIKSNVAGAKDTMVKQRDSFGNLIDTGTNKLDQAAYSDIQNYLSNPSGDRIIKVDDPGWTSDDKIAANISGTYKGPTSFLNSEQEQAATKAVDEATRLGGLVDTTQGRQELLGKLNQRGRTTKGAQDLNAALLQRDKDAFNVLQSAKAETTPLASEYKAIQDALAGKITGAQEESKATSEKLKTEFDPSVIQKAAEERAAKAQKEYQDAYDAYKARVDATSQVGIQGSRFLSAAKDPSQFNAATAATPEEMKKMALMQMLNNGLNPWEGQESLAGTLPTFNEKEVFNEAGYTNAVKQEIDRRNALDAQNRASLEAQDRANAEAEKMKKQQKGAQVGMAVGATAGAAVGSAVPVVGTVAGSIVGGAVGTVIGGAVGCFAGHMEINGVQIKDIKVDGDVYATYSFIHNGPLYDINGVIVTGSHAVKHEGVWMRVKDCPAAKFVGNEELVVFNLSNKSHRIVINGIEFADYDETDFPDAFNDEESLKFLNSGV